MNVANSTFNERNATESGPTIKLLCNEQGQHYISMAEVEVSEFLELKY